MHMMSLVQGLCDKHGEPLMFGISAQGTLAAAGAAFGDATAVRVELPAPNLPYSHAVAASQDKSGDIWLAASFGINADAPSQLYVCGPLSNDPAKWIKEDQQNVRTARFEWEQKRINGLETQIPEIHIGTSDDGLGPPMILIATTLAGGRVPRYERLSAAPKDATAEQFPKFENATELLDVALGSLPQVRGAYALYRIGARRQLEFVGVPDEYNVSMQTSLTPPPGAMALRPEVNKDGHTELIVRGNGVFRFSTADQARSWAQGVKTADDTVPPVRVTSRSVLTDDHRKASGQFGTRKAFRCTITFPADTCQVQIFATEPTPAEVDGKPVTLDPSKGLRVIPSAASRITVSLPANGVTCPTLAIRTNEMSYHQRLYIFPDVELHRSIRELPERALFEARDRLGISGMSESSAAGIQKVVQNLTRSIQYTYNRTDYGFHHDRAVYANNTEDAHFSLSAGGAGHSYQALDRQQARGAVEGAQPITIDDLKDALGGLESVTITTLDKISGDISDAAHRAWNDTLSMFSQTGEDLVRGDLFGALYDLLQGGEQIGMDLFQGAANVFIDSVVGAAKTLVAVVRLAGRTLIFALEHSGKVGKFLAWLLQQVGVGIEKFLAYLSKAIGWDDILKTHDVIRDMINQGLEAVAGHVDDIRKRGNEAIQMWEENMNEALDSAIARLGGVPEQKQTLPNEFSEATEWLAHRFASHAGSAGEIHAPDNFNQFGDTVQKIVILLEDRLGRGGEKVLAALRAAGVDFEKFQNSGKPELLLASMLEVVKALGTIGLEAVGAIWDVLMSILAGLLRAAKDIINQEWEVPFLSDFYSYITNGKKLSLVSVTSLLLAIPATWIHQSISNARPLDKVEFAFAKGLTPMSEGVRGTGAISAAAQFIMSLTNAIQIGFRWRARQGQDLNEKLDEEDSLIKDETKKGFNWLTCLTFVDLACSFAAVGSSLQYGHQDLSRDPFWEYDIAMRGPSEMGWIFLWYSLVPPFFGFIGAMAGLFTQWEWLAKGKAWWAQEIITGARSVTSVGQLVLLIVQQEREKKKQGILAKVSPNFWTSMDPADLRNGLFEAMSPGLSQDNQQKCRAKLGQACLDELTEARDTLQNYLNWANARGIVDKGFGASMLFFPNLFQVCFMETVKKASREYSVPVGLGLNFFCRISGGITASVRTANNALL